MKTPYLTVLIPAFRAMSTVRRALQAVVDSDLPRDMYELVLIDDGSTDETSLVGAEYCDMVVRLAGRPHGPAFARNRGVETTRGEILVFVDADVLVRPDALRRIVETFQASPEVDSVFGSYDDQPDAPGLVSQYRNLLHHYVHHRSRGPAETFWAGLGAIRRKAFLEVGMFDEWHYARPQIEDIELGRRLRLAGKHIVLDPDIQGKHLKRWTLKDTLIADFRHRGVPWMWLLLQEGTQNVSESLNIQRKERILTMLMGVALLMLPLALIMFDWWPLAVAAVLMGIVVVSKVGFYLFLLKARGPLFALGTIPLHLTYYANNVFSVLFGWLVNELFGEPIPPAEVAAHAQMGIATWPPAPRRSKQSMWERQHTSKPGNQP